MNISIEDITNSINKKLPGSAIQLQMAPEHRLKFSVKNNGVPASVLILLYEANNELNTVFMKRPDYSGPHSGQISFPGGKNELSDINYEHTALREANEEIGVISDDINIIGKISTLYIPVSNFEVHPYVGYINYKPNWVIDNNEVAYLIETPTNYLLKQEIRKEEFILHNNIKVKVPYFDINGEKVWGATAMILNELIYILRSI
jgi:8-oxo-dGTP pyrophosphatase MutT (NUDIX family)